MAEYLQGPGDPRSQLPTIAIQLPLEQHSFLALDPHFTPSFKREHLHPIYLVYLHYLDHSHSLHLLRHLNCPAKRC